MVVRVVTGFVPLKDHPRKLEEYKFLGERLGTGVGMKISQPILTMYGDLSDCWFANYLADSQKHVQVAVADNPAKNTLGYHCVQHQKTEWLYAASKLDTVSDVFVWIDFGIFSVPGVTEELIIQAVKRAEHEKAIAIPGCWDTPGDRGDEHPCWRFCGGFLVVPRPYVFALDVAMKAETLAHLDRTNTVTWEVNTLARLELQRKLPLWWFAADHNEKMFANYPETSCGQRLN